MTLLWLGNMKMTALQEPCIASDTTCYCIPVGDCFPNKQEIKIDNCDIEQYKSRELELIYVVTNGAGQDSPEYTVQV